MLEKFIEKHRALMELAGPDRVAFSSYVFEKLLALGRPVTILETGTMWKAKEENEMGAFTYIMADFIKTFTKGRLITVDISLEAIQTCMRTTKEFENIITYVCSDSVKYLQNLSNLDVSKIDLFYLDSYDLDLTNPIPSQTHHLKELEAVLGRVSPTAIISVDDNYMPKTWVDWILLNPDGSRGKVERIHTKDKILGKGTFIHERLLKEGWKCYIPKPDVADRKVLVFEQA